MKKALTDLAIKRLKPPAKGDTSIWDTKITGLGLRCSSGGAKSFIVAFGDRKKRSKKVIGRYPIMSLAEARETARDFLHEATTNKHKPVSPAFSDALDRYLTLREPELRPATFREYKRLLQKHFPFEETLVEDVTKQKIINAIDAISSPSERGHAYVALKVFFNWCLGRDYCSENPLDRMPKPRLSNSRDRVLDDGELRSIWHAAGQMRRYGELVRLLILTGQRAGQIARMHQSWIDEEVQLINFPAEVMKNKVAHTIPYTTLCKTALMVNKPVEGYLFSPPGMPGVAFSAWSKNKAKLDTLMAPIEPWTLHDIRRSWSTLAAKLDVPPHITGRILSHSTSSLNEIDLIYNRHTYQDEMRAAMLTMQDHFKMLFYY